MDNSTAQIRTLNDRFRATGVGNGLMVCTSGFAVLEPETQRFFMAEVVSYSDFTPDNDPHGEHDFGAIRAQGHHVFWKIDYYDPTRTKGSEDPADPDQTCRVLTIMLASEY